jgi:beta-mannosidase
MARETMPVTRIVGSGAARPLQGRWSVAAVKPGLARCPSDLDSLDLEWLSCDEPITAAAALRAADKWDVERPRNFDAEDWWYRCRFTISEVEAPVRLHFQGLATLADVWMNGTLVLHSTSMFVAHTIDLDQLSSPDNELVCRFHALDPLLAARKPRPRWRTALVLRQQLRHFRTTLLGRMATWWPPVAPVGPWRPILIAPASPVRVEHTDLQAELEGDTGVVRVQVLVRPIDTAITGVLRVGNATAPVTTRRLADGDVALDASVRISNAERWWPHTHGAQPLYSVQMSIDVSSDTVSIDLGSTGFRTLQVDRGHDGDGFGVIVNGVPVFCRGVCWTPLDITSLGAAPGDYRSALEQLRAAGMNMIRVPGTMVYESDDFHDLCDELGLLVWQDFMFANMDYPSPDDDPAFAGDVAIEVRQRLEALQGRPSLAVCCGNSEVEQQAAMMGVPRGQCTNALFTDVLPQLVASLVPGVAWLSSTPTGGAYPFQADEGVTHYYGVGAYRRGLDDVRRSGARFVAECLAFSNLPDEPGANDVSDRPRRGPSLRVPRDAGAQWDFEQVRDHYVSELFGVDAAALRESDPARYRALGRVAVGEVMLRTFAEWRRPGSSCRGGLVWYARDFAPGAGWGIVDSSGRAKSAYWYLKRVLAPIALLAIDEGLNGLRLHAINDTLSPLDAELVVALYRDSCPYGSPVSATLAIPPRSFRSIHVDRMFDTFHDLTAAYRLGERGHDVVSATLEHQERGEIIASAHYLPYGLPFLRDGRLHLSARAEPVHDGYALVLEADRFAHAVAVEVAGFVPDDDYLDLEPRHPRTVMLRAEGEKRSPSGTVSALNSIGPVPISCGEPLDVD